MICKNNALHEEGNSQVADQEEEDHFFVATWFSKSSTDSWLIDSRCTNHMTHDESLFKELKPVEIQGSDRKWRSPSCQWNGTTAIKMSTDTKKVSEVLYVPEIDHNLLSLGHLMEKGFKVFFEDHHCQISDTTERKEFFL